MTLLEKRMLGLNRDLSAAFSKVLDDAKPKSVHRLRTTIRRIESLISYANPQISKKEERTLEKLTDLRKRAGKVRDLDVQTDLLLALGNGSTAKDRKTLASLMEKKRSHQVRRLESAIKKLHEAKFFGRLDRIAEEAGVPQDNKNRPLAPLEEAKAQLVAIANNFGSRQALGEGIKPSRLHETRIDLKRIRYLAEIAEESPEQKKFMRELKSTQDALGDWHDWQELAERAEKRFSDRASCALLREVRTLLSARHSDAISSLNKLFSLMQAPARKPPHSTQALRFAARHA
jgi:CHAD domain-containing protein